MEKIHETIKGVNLKENFPEGVTMEKIHETIKELESLLSEYEKINQNGKLTYRINSIVGQIEILEDIKNNTDIVVEGWKAALKEDKAND